MQSICVIVLSCKTTEAFKMKLKSLSFIRRFLSFIGKIFAKRRDTTPVPVHSASLRDIMESAPPTQSGKPTLGKRTARLVYTIHPYMYRNDFETIIHWIGMVVNENTTPKQARKSVCDCLPQLFKEKGEEKNIARMVVDFARAASILTKIKRDHGEDVPPRIIASLIHAHNIINL